MEPGSLIRKLRWAFLALENIYVTNGSMENARAAVAQNQRNRTIRDAATLVTPLQRSA